LRPVSPNVKAGTPLPPSIDNRRRPIGLNLHPPVSNVLELFPWLAAPEPGVARNQRAYRKRNASHTGVVETVVWIVRPLEFLFSLLLLPEGSASGCGARKIATQEISPGPGPIASYPDPDSDTSRPGDVPNEYRQHPM